MAQEITLSRGKFAIVDEEDFEWLNQYKWFAVKSKGSKSWYAVRRIDISHKSYSILMHREIMQADIIEYNGQRLDVHHFDNDGLNNRRNNMVLCLPREHRGRRLFLGKEIVKEPFDFLLAVLNPALNVKSTKHYRELWETSNRQIGPDGFFVKNRI